MLASTKCCTSKGLEVLRDHTNRVCGVAATVYRREQGPRRFDRKLDSEDGGGRSGRGLREGIPETHLRMGKAWGLSTELPDRELGPCEGFLARGSHEDLGEACAILDTSVKNTGVIDGSLHISTLLFSFRIYIDYITSFAVEIATH